MISVDRGVNGVDVDCAIASDNVEGAKMATEYMVSLLGENAKVAELEGVSGASATIERGKDSIWWQIKAECCFQTDRELQSF